MKRYMLYAVLVTFIVIVLSVVVEVNRLKLLVGNDPIIVPELTKEEKEDDMEAMFEIIRDVYPFAEWNVNVKGLSDIHELKDAYVRRAGETWNNEDYLRLVIEVTEYIRQTGHGGIKLVEDYNLYRTMTQNIPKDAYLKLEYWQTIGSNLTLYVHSDLALSYESGEYIVQESYLVDDQFIPAGSVIVQIDTLGVDEYVRHLESHQTLGFDITEDQLFAFQLFMTDSNPLRETWDIVVRTPDDDTIQFELEKKEGYRDVNAYERTENLSIVPLNQDTVYFGISSFSYEFIVEDGLKMQAFFEENPYEYDQLIIDLRNNGGGEINYWIDNLVEPLISERKNLVSTTAVKRSFEQRMGYHLWLYRQTTANDLLDKSNGVIDIQRIKHEDFPDSDWRVYRINKQFEPKHHYQFNGELIVLTNPNTLSAADSYVNAVKQLGIGTVAGERTGGWGNHYSGPMTFSLPMSGIMFYMDVEVALNDAGLPTSIYGTQPDVVIDSFRIPSPIPADMSAETIITDPWIRWVLNQ